MAKQKMKAVLDQPGDDAPEIAKQLWYASGPGRAWKWEQWALSIKPDDPQYALAQSVLKQVKEIRACYKSGNDARAGVLVERLAATRFAAPLAKHAKDIVRTQNAQKQLDDANAERSDNAESLTRQVANLYTAICSDNQDRSATNIYSEILSKIEISDRTLQTHLANARRLGLIPKRHCRIRS